MEQFIKFNLFEATNVVVPERQVLGPYSYARAELVSVGVEIPDDGNETLGEALDTFCGNQSTISKRRHAKSSACRWLTTPCVRR